MELGNQAEFVGAMTRSEMLSMFFVHDGGSTRDWRLKGHALQRFWDWVAEWAIAFRKPSDLGYADNGFILPPLNINDHVIDVPSDVHGLLFDCESKGLLERRQARAASIDQRVTFAADMVNASEKPWLVWCDLNAESDALTKAIPDAVEVKGADTQDHKRNAIMGFVDGSIRVLVTKPKIAGYGMNLQHCADMVFVGLSDSYESMYQATRRCWRFGQENQVNVHVVAASTEAVVRENVKRKEEDAKIMVDQMVADMKGKVMENIKGMARTEATYTTDANAGEAWEMLLGDCVERVAAMDEASIDYTVFSPPFASLYTYSNSDRDMGNCADGKEFAEHFAHLVPELLRVTKPGRNLSFHCMNLPTSKVRDGIIGISDFRGELIRTFVEAGWIYHSEVVIWKDPVTAMHRTKALGLLHKQLKKDSCMSRQGIPDYLVTMRKPGTNQDPVEHSNESFPVREWQQYASPVWDDINPSDTITFRSAREHADERHVCPLQLEVIRRALRLWSRPNDLVLSPFAGVGSEGAVSIEQERRFIGVELKRSYYDQACRNLDAAELAAKQGKLF